MQETHRSSPMEVHIDWEKLDNPGLPDQLPILADIGLNAASAAVMSGLSSLMREGGQNLEEWRAGKIDEKQFTYRMVHKATDAAVTNGVRTGSALVLSEGAKKAILKLWGQAVLKRATRYNALTAICFGLVDQSKHTYQLAKGTLDKRQYKIKSVENVGGTGGAISGAAAGAVLGSVVPGLGTGAGAMLGYLMAMFGASSGAAMGKNLGEKWFPGDGDDDNQLPRTPTNRIDIPIID